MILIVDFTVHHRRFLDKLLGYLDARKHPYIVCETAQEIADAHKNHNIRHIIMSGSEAYIGDTLQDKRYIAMFRALEKMPKYIPRLGICFGAQLLYHNSGGQLQRMSRFICSRRKLEYVGFDGEVQFCLHEAFQEPCPPLLEYTAWARLDKSFRPCAIRHRKHPWTGILFHPEDDPKTWIILDMVLV
jgi:anthranilate/para-aminobenzoate synthase component II